MIEYGYDEYLADMVRIKEDIGRLIDRGHVNINVVGLHRGSLPMAVHLSNILPAKMSIINYQTRDGDSKKPEFVINTIKKDDTIILLDDIYDSGKTIRDTTRLLKSMYPEQYIAPFVLFGKDNEEDCTYMNIHTGDWIQFPWEKDVESAVDFW